MPDHSDVARGDPQRIGDLGRAVVLDDREREHCARPPGQAREAPAQALVALDARARGLVQGHESVDQPALAPLPAVPFARQVPRHTEHVGANVLGAGHAPFAQSRERDDQGFLCQLVCGVAVPQAAASKRTEEGQEALAELGLVPGQQGLEDTACNTSLSPITCAGMMNKALIGLGVLLLLLGALGLGARVVSAARESAVYEATLADLPIPDDEASLAEGERLFISRGCGGADCHTRDAGGHVLMQDGPLGTITASNLSAFAREAGPRDWDRAVRHGMRADGRSLVFMPSVDFASMPDRELGLIAAYVRSLAPVERALPPNDLSMLARVLDLAGALVLFPAGHIDHSATAPNPEPGRTVEYGAYLARLCTGCHGAQLSGGPIPGAPPELGNPRNLTFHETGLAGWREEDFRVAMRQGRTPDGGTLDPAQMPWRDLGQMTDDELGALYLYLQTLPHVPEGSR